MKVDAAEGSTRWNKWWISVVSTQLGGGLATLALFPLDTVRFRMMSQDGTTARMHHHGIYYSGPFHTAKLMINEEGVRSLFRGASVAVCGAAVSWGIYMSTYRCLQDVIKCDSQNAFYRDAGVSTFASCFNAWLTTPIWLIKTRMQVEDVASSHDGRTRNYPSFWRGVKHVIKTDGPRGLWCGVGTQTFMSVPNALYFPAYERLKWMRLKTSPRKNDKLAAWEISACSVLGKVMLAVLTNPFFVVRTRLQDIRAATDSEVVYLSTVDAARNVARREGLKGFFRGLGPSMMLTAPKTAVSMVLMEKIAETLKRWR